MADFKISLSAMTGLALFLAVAMSNGFAQPMPLSVVAEDPANNAVAEKRSSDLKELSKARNDRLRRGQTPGTSGK